MNQTAGAILSKRVSAIQTRGHSHPILSELAAKLEYAAKSRHRRWVVNRGHFYVTAVIDRCRMDVAGLARLNAGELSPLSDVMLSEVVSEMKVDGAVRQVGRGRLGACRRNKAVRIIEPPERSSPEPLADKLGVRIGHE